MVTPQDLLDLAERLATAPSEAELRASISRAYYAAFHHCREFVDARVGLPHTGTADDHREVISALWQLDPQASQRLRTLRARRNRADYEIQERVTARDARFGCFAAARLLELE